MTSPQFQVPSTVAYEFIRSLATELSAGKVDVPSFPEVAVRVRRVLTDPNVAIEQVVRVVGSEPALAARLLRIANSASLNRSGRPVGDLRTAVNRVGYNMVRGAAIAFAMAQIRQANRLAGLTRYLDDLWRRSTRVAAFAFVLARTCSTVNPDEALLCGMMHGIGKLYVLTRATQHPELFSESATLDGIVADWHAAIGRAILENWEFSAEMAEAVGDQDHHGNEEPGPADLRDIIAIASLMASYAGDLSGIELALHGLPASARLGLDEARTSLVMHESAAEVAALSSALGD